MTEEKSDFGLQQFNAGDLLKRYIVTQVFRTLDDACHKQETVADESFETSFTTRVNLIEGLLWKYTPQEIKDAIKKLYDEMVEKILAVDNEKNKDMSPTNKTLNKKTISYEYNLEIFKLLEVVLTNSPISIEFADMEVMGDYKELIKSIRQKDRIKLFTEVTV